MIVVGILMAAIGIVIAIASENAANSMTVWEYLSDPEQYDAYMAASSLGWGIGVFGGALFLIGLIGGLTVGQEQQKQTPGQPSQMPYTPAVGGGTYFCQYCGRPIAPDAVWCPGCGRSLKKQP